MNSLPQLKRAGYLPVVLIPGIAEWALASPERLWSTYYRRLMLTSGGSDQKNIGKKIDQRLINLYESQLKDPLAIRAMANWYRANADPQWWRKQQLRVKIDTPTLSLLGEDDPFVIWDYARDRPSHITNHTTKIIKNAGHWPHLEQYQFVNREIQDWLESDPPSR